MTCYATVLPDSFNKHDVGSSCRCPMACKGLIDRPCAVAAHMLTRVCCRWHAQARAASGVEQAGALATTLGNVHAYYSQFRPQVQAAIDSAMKELEKQLQVL